MKSHTFLPTAAFCAMALTLCTPANGADPRPLYQQADATVEERVQDLLGRITVEEKARQLDLYAGSNQGAEAILDHRRNATHAATDSHFLPDGAARVWGELGVGAIHDLYPYPQLGNEIQDWIIRHNRLGIPALFLEEGVHGAQSFDETVFPAPINLGTTWDTDLAQQTASVIAAEMRARGIHMCLGPVLDVAREPRWGRIEEGMGEDPYLIGQMGLAYVQGMQGDSLTTNHTIIAEPKHFAGHGSPEGGLNTASVHVGEREMRSVMLKSFEPAISRGKAMAIMAAYHDIDGVPCTANPWLMLDVLRGEMGFKGFVLSDLGAIKRLENAHHVAADPEMAVCLAINSGVDMQFYDYPHDVFQQAIVHGIASGKLSGEALDRAVGAVLRAKFMLGLFEHPFTDTGLDAKVSRAHDHLDLSLRSSRESMCLLKNEGKLLPLSKSVGTVAVIGPNADKAQVGDYAEQAVGKLYSVLDGIRQVVPQANVLFDDGTDIAAAVAKAKDAEVVIAVMGERQGISGEGFDRTSLDLPGNQQALLEVLVAMGKPVVLVLENGRPLSVAWASEHVPAILEAWYPGEFGGIAVAETLFGDNNPSGRLPISIPRSVGQSPVFYNHGSSARPGKYVEGSNKPLYAFGAGLSYTTFGYQHLEVEVPPGRDGGDIAVSAEVTNTGSVEGDEVSQFYVRQETASVVTPAKSLKGFCRTHLKPGETKTIHFTMSRSELAVWSARNRWEVEPGSFAALVGGSSDDGLNAKFVLE